jgi:hypothetical protein
MALQRPIDYLRSLPGPRIVLWCYLLWYLSMASMHFDPSPRLWVTSLGLGVLIGVGLILSIGRGAQLPDAWTLARLFMMPFCVSSFAALVKGRDFVLVFSPVLRENLIAASACVAFLALAYGARWIKPARSPSPSRQ